MTVILFAAAIFAAIHYLAPTPMQIAVLVAIWLIVTFLTLPTRNVLPENLSHLRRLKVTDRRAANLVRLHQRQLFICASLVGIEKKKQKVTDSNGYTRIESVELQHFPKLSKASKTATGFKHSVTLPANYGVTAAKAHSKIEELDGFISHLLRHITPDVTTTVEVKSGATIELSINLRDEFIQVISPNEV